MNHRQRGICLAFLGIGAIMFYFILISPPMTDNFLFSRDIRPGYAAYYSGSPIESLKPMTIAAAFRQATEMYFTWCGRYMGNLMVYLLFMLPHWLYSLLAAGAFALYVWLLQMCVFGKQWRQHLSASWILGIAALLWASIPSFGSAFFWLSVGGEITLVAQAAIFLPFRFALDGGQPKARGFLPQILICAALGLAGMATVSLDYPTSAVMPPTAVACVIWLWWRGKKQKHHFPWQSFCTALGLCIGGAITLLAPGNACRVRLTTDPRVHAYELASWGERISDWLGHLPLAALYQVVPLLFIIWGCVALRRQYASQWFRHVPEAEGLFLLPALLLPCAFLFTAWPPLRAFVTSTTQLIVCGCIIFSAIQPGANAKSQRQFRWLRLFLAGYCVVTIPYEAINFMVVHKTINEREAILAKAPRDTIVELPPLNGHPDRYMVLGYHLNDLTVDPDFWVNRAVAAHYGVAGVRLAPTPESRATYIWSTPSPAIPDTYFSIRENTGGTGSMRINLEKGHIHVAMPKASAPDDQKIHLYYYGAPALINHLPFGLGDPIYRWLKDSPQDSFAAKLIPILLARTDIHAHESGPEELHGISPPLKIRKSERIWLVRPGQGTYSFDLIPLDKATEAATP